MTASMHSTTRSLILSRPVVVVSLLIAFALIVGAAALSMISTGEVSAADRRAAHAQQTVSIINQLLATMNEAETGQRGYILTRDDKYLAPYESARTRYRNELAALAHQFADNPGRAGMLSQISRLCDARLAEMEHTVQLRRDHGIASALNVVESDEGWRLMDEIRRRIQVLQRQEIADATNQTASAAARARIFQQLNGGLLALAIALAGTAAWLIIRRLHDLEGLIKVCAWTQRVQWKGQWITFEEYLAQRFNLHCTHGISDEAARQLRNDIANTPVPPDVQHG
jgi:CHASE3 domain sensor protein